MNMINDNSSWILNNVIDSYGAPKCEEICGIVYVADVVDRYSASRSVRLSVLNNIATVHAPNHTSPRLLTIKSRLDAGLPICIMKENVPMNQLSGANIIYALPYTVDTSDSNMVYCMLLTDLVTGSSIVKGMTLKIDTSKLTSVYPSNNYIIIDWLIQI